MMYICIYDYFMTVQSSMAWTFQFNSSMKRARVGSANTTP
jgi:hypothetical protein